MYGAIIVLHHMQHYVIIGRVVIMVMAMPITSANVNFNITGPNLAIDTHFSVKEVGAGAFVESTGVNDVNATPVSGCHAEFGP
jgi:hypothetical protein